MKSFILLNFIIYFFIVCEADTIPVGPSIGLNSISSTTRAPTTWVVETENYYSTTTDSPLTTPNPDPNPKEDISNSIIWNIILNGSSINNSTIILNYSG
ncbi:hypothetical protein WA026_022696 [Henosepilachna vigintioctopunctata]|uniref:Uncharacterized protein n=1 Tax=Henosepilachna vigintioctopunctata TaxID=420089 RepID=A0AAW1U253_9CUCU